MRGMRGMLPVPTEGDRDDVEAPAAAKATRDRDGTGECDPSDDES